MAFDNIIVETRGRVGLITLNRPQAMNAPDFGKSRSAQSSSFLANPAPTPHAVPCRADLFFIFFCL